MPGLVRKLLIFAAVDGLVLQPAPPRNNKPTTEQAIKLDYMSSRIGPLLKDHSEEDTAPSTLEVHGIVGIFDCTVWASARCNDVYQGYSRLLHPRTSSRSVAENRLRKYAGSRSTR